MLVQTTDKWVAAHALINTWLKDKQVYCGNCDSNYDERFFPCCEEPVLADNFGHTKAIVEAIKDKRECLHNEYASDKKKNFRSTIMIPSRLYHLLNGYYKKHGMKLFDNANDQIGFMKRFPMFKVPTRI